MENSEYLRGLADGIETEREDRERWLNRVRTWYQEKADIWYEGYETAEERIVKLLEAECDCAFYEKYEIPSKCDAHNHIALIKGEK
jgi:hypothetical protein